MNWAETIKEIRNKMLLNQEKLVKETAQTKKEMAQEEVINEGRNASPDFFNEIKNRVTSNIVTRVADDIDVIVKRIRFDVWQNNLQGKENSKKELIGIIWINIKLKIKMCLIKSVVMWRCTIDV